MVETSLKISERKEDARRLFWILESNFRRIETSGIPDWFPSVNIGIARAAQTVCSCISHEPLLAWNCENPTLDYEPITPIVWLQFLAQNMTDPGNSLLLKKDQVFLGESDGCFARELLSVIFEWELQTYYHVLKTVDHSLSDLNQVKKATDEVTSSISKEILFQKELFRRRGVTPSRKSSLTRLEDAFMPIINDASRAKISDSTSLDRRQKTLARLLWLDLFKTRTHEASSDQPAPWFFDIDWWIYSAN